MALAVFDSGQMALAQPGRGDGVPGGGMGGGMGWGMAGGRVFAVLLLVLLVVAVAALVALMLRWLGPAGKTTEANHLADRQRARATLDERYAQGQIDRDEYLQKKKDLAIDP